MHIVELQYSKDAAEKVVVTMRNWLDNGKAQPTVRFADGRGDCPACPF